MLNTEQPQQRDFSPVNKQESQDIVDGKKEELPDFIGKTLELISRISKLFQNKDVQEQVGNFLYDKKMLTPFIVNQAIELKNVIASQNENDKNHPTYLPSLEGIGDNNLLAYSIKEGTKTDKGGTDIVVVKKEKFDRDIFYSQTSILVQSLRKTHIVRADYEGDKIKINISPKILPVPAKEGEREKAPAPSVSRVSPEAKLFKKPLTPKAPVEGTVESTTKSTSAKSASETSKTPLQKKQEFYDPANPNSTLPPSHRFGNAIRGSDGKPYLIRNRFAPGGVTWWEKMELKGDMTDSLEKRRESNWVQISKDDPLVAAKMAQVRQWMPDVASRAEKVQPKQVWQPEQVRNMPYNVDAKYKHGFQRPGDNARVNKWG